MNAILQQLETHIIASPHLSDEEKNQLRQSISAVDKQLAITEFKLDRTEKVKRTTAILLEETIAELEQKRKAIEESNDALQKSLAELKAAQAQLIQAEKMASLGELTAGIAHEIQNPLNFVNNFSEINVELISELVDELNSGNTEEAKAIANDINNNEKKINEHGKRAGSIVKGMLEHSRKSDGQMDPTDINQLADECLRLAYHGMRAKDKTLQADYEADFDTTLPKVAVVSQDISRVLLNLINNAFYAVNEKAKTSEKDYVPRVIVSTAQQNGKVMISVRDNGNGIAEELREKIFQPFFTTKPTGSGTGLGLSLSYDIIKAHGGDIMVSTEPSEYTCFTIALPIR